MYKLKGEPLCVLRDTAARMPAALCSLPLHLESALTRRSHFVLPLLLQVLFMCCSDNGGIRELHPIRYTCNRGWCLKRSERWIVLDVFPRLNEFAFFQSKSGNFEIGRRYHLNGLHRQQLEASPQLRELRSFSTQILGTLISWNQKNKIKGMEFNEFNWNMLTVVKKLMLTHGGHCWTAIEGHQLQILHLLGRQLDSRWNIAHVS